MRTLWHVVIVMATMILSPAGARGEAAPDPAVVHANAVRAPGSAPYREGWFGSGDTRLHYVEAGSGPLILLYHGFPSFWYGWFDQMEALKGRYRVVAVDGLGANLSAKPSDLAPYRVARLAKQIDRLARHLNGRKRFTLVGHDWGAALAFAYAEGYPRRLDGVVGIAAPPFNLFLDLVGRDAAQKKQSQYMQLYRTLTRADIVARGLPARFFDVGYGSLVMSGALSAAEGELFRAALADPAAIDGGMNWYRANVPAFDAIGAGHRWPRGDGRITVPALLIWGDADRTFVPAAAERFPAYAPKGRVVHVAGANHWVMMEAPDAVNSALDGFLTDVATRGAK